MDAASAGGVARACHVAARGNYGSRGCMASRRRKSRREISLAERPRATACGLLVSARPTLRVRAVDDEPWSNWTDTGPGPSDTEGIDASLLASLSMEEGDSIPADVLNSPGFVEKAILVGVGIKTPVKERAGTYGFSTEESVAELERLADTAGLQVAATLIQMLPEPNNRTYIGTGKIGELSDLIQRTGAMTVLCDDELTPRQQRNLEKALDQAARVGDRTALILDVFSQRAATREGKLQVEMAKAKYELPRLTRMWSHLERQAGGGQVKGMGEKQIEIDKRLLRKRIEGLQKDIDAVSETRGVYRRRRREAGLPVMALVGYTNAGKSTLINRLAGADTLAEDKLFATLDPTTRRLELESGKEILLTDTVGFIQKLPTQLVAAFRATLEEINEASLLLHVVDVSDPKAAAQSEAVYKVLKDIGADNIPMITIWNKVDATADPDAIMTIAAGREQTACVSASTGFGMEDLLGLLEVEVEKMMVPMLLLVPYQQGDLMGELYKKGVVKQEEFHEKGILVSASVPQQLVSRCKLLVTEQTFSCHG